MPASQADSAVETGSKLHHHPHATQTASQAGPKREKQVRTVLSSGETKKQASARLDTGLEDTGVKRGSSESLGLTGLEDEMGAEEFETQRRFGWDTSFNLTPLSHLGRKRYRHVPDG